MIILIPLSGAANWFLGIEAAGEAHEVLTTVLLMLVGLHIAGALYHQFVLRDGTTAWMLPVLRA